MTLDKIKKAIEKNDFSLGDNFSVTLNRLGTFLGAGQTLPKYEILDKQAEGLSTEICLIEGKILDLYSCDSFDSIEEFIDDLERGRREYIKGRWH